MVHSCAVRNCKAKWYPGTDIKFHLFPKDEEQRKTWLSKVPLKIKYYEQARICSLHFNESDYDMKCIKSTSVPFYVDGKSSSEEDETNMPILCESTGNFQSTPGEDDTSVICDITTSSKNEQCFITLGSCSDTQQIDDDEKNLPNTKAVQVTLKTPRMIQLAKQNKLLRYILRRQNKKMESMQDALAEAQRYTSQPEIENVIHGRFSVLCKKLNRPTPQGVRYSDEVKNFALSVNFCSPKAYRFIKKYIALPNIKSIRRQRREAHAKAARRANASPCHCDCDCTPPPASEAAPAPTPAAPTLAAPAPAPAPIDECTRE